MAKETQTQTQRKTLGELLRGDLTPIEYLIRQQIQKMHPGSQVNYGDSLKNLAVDYIAPELPRDLCIMVDSSGSSQSYFPLICEGAREAFKAGLGDGVRRNYSVANFSGQTLFSGWVPKTQYQKLEPTLTTFQGNGTKLSEAMLGYLQTHSNPFASLIVTDGIIENLSEVLHTFRNLIDKGNKVDWIYLDLNNTHEMDAQLAGVVPGICLYHQEDILPAMKSYVQNKFSFVPKRN